MVEGPHCAQATGPSLQDDCGLAQQSRSWLVVPAFGRRLTRCIVHRNHFPNSDEFTALIYRRTRGATSPRTMWLRAWSSTHSTSEKCDAIAALTASCCWLCVREWCFPQEPHQLHHTRISQPTEGAHFRSHGAAWRREKRLFISDEWCQAPRRVRLRVTMKFSQIGYLMKCTVVVGSSTMRTFAKLGCLLESGVLVICSIYVIY